MGSDFLITGDHLLNANKTSKGCGLRRCNSYNIVKNVFVNLLVADLISCTMLLSCIIVVQSLSNVWLFATPWTSACQASLPSLSPGVCSDSCPLSPWGYLTISSSSPFASSLSQHQGLFQWVSSSHQVAKVLELQHQSFQWIFSLISFRISWFDLLADRKSVV